MRSGLNVTEFVQQLFQFFHVLGREALGHLKVACFEEGAHSGEHLLGFVGQADQDPALILAGLSALYVTLLFQSVDDSREAGAQYAAQFRQLF